MWCVNVANVKRWKGRFLLEIIFMDVKSDSSNIFKKIKVFWLVHLEILPFFALDHVMLNVVFHSHCTMFDFPPSVFEKHITTYQINSNTTKSNVIISSKTTQ